MSKHSVPSEVKKTVTSTYTLGDVTVTSRVTPEEGGTVWDFNHPEFGEFIGLTGVDLRAMSELLREMKKDKVF
jgi:hypothetical protein